MKGVGVLGRFGLIERLNQVWFAADIHIFIDIYIPSIHSSTLHPSCLMVSFCCISGGAFCLV